MEASGQLIAAAKHVLGLRGVAVRADTRAPLRPLEPAQAAALEVAVAPYLAPAPARSG